MARRRKRFGRGKKSRAIPLVQTGMLVIPLVESVKEQGFTPEAAVAYVNKMSGYHMRNRTMDWNQLIKVGGALLLVQLIGSKIATKTGANKFAKKISGGYIKFA